jgi:hypothetical protein
MRCAVFVFAEADLDARRSFCRAEALLRLGQWLFPWGCVTGIAVLLVGAAQLEFAVSAASMAQATLTPEPAPGKSRLRWVALFSMDASGNGVSMTCLAAGGSVRQDQIYMSTAALPDVGGLLRPDLHNDP